MYLHPFLASSSSSSSDCVFFILCVGIFMYLSRSLSLSLITRYVNSFDKSSSSIVVYAPLSSN